MLPRQRTHAVIEELLDVSCQGKKTINFSQNFLFCYLADVWGAPHQGFAVILSCRRVVAQQLPSGESGGDPPGKRSRSSGFQGMWRHGRLGCLLPATFVGQKESCSCDVGRNNESAVLSGTRRVNISPVFRKFGPLSSDVLCPQNGNKVESLPKKN
jgi:hypothetical protein